VGAVDEAEGTARSAVPPPLDRALDGLVLPVVEAPLTRGFSFLPDTAR
jgi:hypothetical protein